MDRKFILGSIATLALSGLIYRYFRNRRQKIILSQRLEEYLAEIEQQLKKLSGMTPSIELIAYIVNCLEEIEDYLYIQDNAENEEQRVQYLNTDKKKYEAAVFEAIRIHDLYMEKARDILEKRLGISMQNIREIMQNTTEHKKMAECLKQCRKAYTDLPEVAKENLKKAYITWAKLSNVHAKISNQLFEAAKNNPTYQSLAFESFIVNKYLLRDKILGEFKIEDKYLESLLIKHNLTEDPEIKEATLELMQADF